MRQLFYESWDVNINIIFIDNTQITVMYIISLVPYICNISINEVMHAEAKYMQEGVYICVYECKEKQQHPLAIIPEQTRQWHTS